MGKAFQGVFGNFSGKVGNVVGRVRQGQNVYAIYQPVVSNPRTPAQVAAREKFTLLVKFGAIMLEAIKEGFRDLDGYKRGTPLSSFVGYNSKITDIIDTDVTPHVVMYSYVVISQGIVPLPYSPSATLDSNTVMLTWTDNSGIGDARETDVSRIVVYNPAKGEMVMGGEANRSSRNASLTLPASWSGDSVEAYCYFWRESDSKASKSVYLGSLNL